MTNKVLFSQNVNLSRQVKIGHQSFHNVFFSTPKKSGEGRLYVIYRSNLLSYIPMLSSSLNGLIYEFTLVAYINSIF